MRISDWSSDVCSSDLGGRFGPREHADGVNGWARAYRDRIGACGGYYTANGKRASGSVDRRGFVGGGAPGAASLSSAGVARRGPYAGRHHGHGKQSRWFRAGRPPEGGDRPSRKGIAARPHLLRQTGRGNFRGEGRWMGWAQTKM